LLKFKAKTEADGKEEQENPDGQSGEEKFHSLNNSSIRDKFRIRISIK
jgi:hypothetical protein